VRLKLRLCWNILRGRPVAYRLHFHDGKHLVGWSAYTLIAQCEFTQTPKHIYRCDFEEILSQWLPGFLAGWLARHWPRISSKSQR